MSDSRPILFATDGSPSAAEAQKEAFELAQRLDAPLLVVSVAHAAMPAVGYAGYGYSNVVAELTKAERHRVEKLLGTIAATACAAEVPCSTVVADGFPVEDDHKAFLDAGVPSVDVIDLDYSPWHTERDTLDAVSARSLQIVGDDLLAALPQIETRAINGR